MSKQQRLHPTVLQFKQFMKEHPSLIEEVNQNHKTLQDIYEEWTVLGAEHEHWQPYKQKRIDVDSHEDQSNQNQQATHILSQVMGMVSRMNVDDLQNHLAQFSSLLSNVQNVIQTFQRPTEQPKTRPHDHPFSFRRD